MKLSECFTLSKFNISKEQGTTTENTDIVHCTKLDKITNYVLLPREYLVNNLIKLRIDSGGSFLKMSVNVIKTSQGIETSSPKQSTSKLLTTSTALDTRIKHQLIIAIVEEVPANFWG